MGSFVVALRSARPVLCSTVLTSLVSVLVACGDGGSDDSPAQSAEAPATLPPPVESVPDLAGTPVPEPLSIVGSPKTTIRQGLTYSFAPTALIGDDRPLSFHISHRPPWTSFEVNTGRLSGTPGPADVGHYSDILISVSDGQQSASLTPFELDVIATASGSFVVAWDPPVAHVDGSPISGLAGFKVYFGTDEGDYPNSVTIMNPGITTTMIEELTPATYFVVATSFNTEGVESQFSNVAARTVL